MEFNESMCRFCMGTDEVAYDIFDESEDTLRKCFMYLHIKINRMSGVSNCICADCYSILNGFDRFYEKTHEINEMLKKKSLVNIFRKKSGGTTLTKKNKNESKIVCIKKEDEVLIAEPLEMEVSTLDDSDGEKIMIEEDPVDVFSAAIEDEDSNSSNFETDTTEKTDFDPEEYEKFNPAKKLKTDDNKSCVCNICDASLSSKSALTRHMNAHTRRKVYQCPMCDYETTEMFTLRAHLYTHNTEKSYGCEFCDRCFKTPASLSSHMKSHHSDEATCYPCRKCPKKCFTKQILKEHMEEFHTTTSKGEPNSTMFKCQLCDEKVNLQNFIILDDNTATKNDKINAIYHNQIQIASMMIEFVAADKIRTSVFKEVINGDHKKIDSEEAFEIANEKVENSLDYQASLKTVFFKNLSTSKGLAASVKDAIRATFDKNFLPKLGWQGVNSIKFADTAISNLLTDAALDIFPNTQSAISKACSDLFADIKRYEHKKKKRN